MFHRFLARIHAYLPSWCQAKPTLSPELAQRLARWQALPDPDWQQHPNTMHAVVLDVETSGFSLRKDRLIAIGACRLQGQTLPLTPTFHRILRQSNSSSKANILVHQIGRGAQMNGLEPAEALMQFLEYMGKAPLLAYNVGFDRPMLDKALRRYLGVSLAKHLWLDVAFLAPMYCPEKSRHHKSLDFWMYQFELRNLSRHDATADAMVTAQLMQIIQRRLPEDISLAKLKQAESKATRIHRELHGPI